MFCCISIQDSVKTLHIYGSTYPCQEITANAYAHSLKNLVQLVFPNILLSMGYWRWKSFFPLSAVFISFSVDRESEAVKEKCISLEYGVLRENRSVLVDARQTSFISETGEY
ncbi:hypothetical protein IFM89_001451 [Coptis chinensis]|uniref:Uncharacterized protein n=1 Tax=Coptis chinensis TaxID=261450 RepID=A0A835H3K2_9MAGN|nr:hypothetical protein IFM89_001451 [Coptis chinensis]